jgi:hypothetical protein
MTKDQFDKFKADIVEIKEKYNVDDSDVSQAFRQVIKDTEHKRIIQKAKENKKYVGKCYVMRTKPRSGMFPEMNRYYKIISCQSSNEYHVEALAFDEHPTYFFNYQGNHFCGNFSFEGFNIEDIFVQTLINSLKEISEEEYWAAAGKYLSELREMTWYANHYRCGGKLPTDPGWAIEGVKKNVN